MPCKKYKITSTAPFKIIQFNPCCGNPISPLPILNPPGITYICSSTVPVLPTGVSYTLMGECCIPTPTPTKTKTPTPTPTPTKTKTPTPTPTRFSCNCVQYLVTNNTPNNDKLKWIDCNGVKHSYTLPGNTSKPTFCACNGSLAYQYSTVTILQGGCGQTPTPTPTKTKTPTPTPTKTKTPTPTQLQCACFTANNPYNFSISIRYTNCYNIPDQGIMVPAFGTTQFCALLISSDPYGIASPTGICSNNQDCNVPTPTPTLTPTKTKTPTPTPTKTPTPTPTKQICKNYKITVTSVFEIIQFTPCCGSPSSPMSVGQGITYVCSLTFPSVPTGVSCTLFGDCPTCPTPTPTPTKTKTPTPTPTKTPTPTPTLTPAPIIPECSVLINNVNTGGNVSAYFPSSNTNVFLGNFSVSSPDIAHTTTKLWLYSGGVIKEYDITLIPWSATFNRNITYPSGVNLGSGLGSITNTQLISTNTSVSPNEIIVLDITTSTAVSTVIGTLEADRTVSGDILLTTTNKILVTNQSTTSTYLTQYSYPSGTFEVEVDITSTTLLPLGLFIDSGNIYVCGSNGYIYNVDVNFPYTQTLFNYSGLLIGGASQVPSCNNANLIVPCTSCTTVGLLPQLGNSVTYNGTTISATGTGSISVAAFPSFQGEICPLPLPNISSPTVSLGSGSIAGAPFTYTLTFSVPVNDIVIRIYSYQSSFTTPQAESFTFTTNMGSGIPVISSCQYCCATINGNTITGSVSSGSSSLICENYNGQGYTVGNGIFTISNSSPFTTLTVTGPGGIAGSAMDICIDSLDPNPTPTPTVTPGLTPTPTPTLTPTPGTLFCFSPSLLPILNNSVTYNGVTITASGSGSVQSFPASGQYSCVPVIGGDSALDTVVLGNQIFTPNFTYTLTFSTPVNNIIIRLFGYEACLSGYCNGGQLPPYTESFTLTTNGGGTQTITDNAVTMDINGNTLTVYSGSGAPCTYTGFGDGQYNYGSGVFKISSTLPYSTLTITGPGGLGGTICDICADSIIPSTPGLTQTPTQTPTLTPTCVGITNNTIYIKYNTIP